MACHFAMLLGNYGAVDEYDAVVTKEPFRFPSVSVVRRIGVFMVFEPL
jgi:hypothetical protein